MTTPTKTETRLAGDGLLVVDKPSGPTSHDVVAVVRRTLGIRRIGHSGTLDPMASGVLVLLLGRGTRLASLVTAHDKAYEGEGQLGWATDTYDRTGRQTGERADTTGISQARLAEAAAAHTGSQLQVPPSYSARKVNGVPLYRRARRGETVEAAATAVEVPLFEVELLAQGRFRFRTEVSSGTYIRSLLHDVGKLLGCGGHLLALRRTRVGPFDLTMAVPLATLQEDPGRCLVEPTYLTLDRIPLDLPVLQVGPEDAEALSHGRPFRAPEAGSDASLFQVRDAGNRLLALACPGAEAGFYRPRTVFPVLG